MTQCTYYKAFKCNYLELISAVDSVSMCMFLRACTHFAMTDELRVMESVW